MAVWLRVDHWPSAVGRHPRLRCGVLYHIADRNLSFHGIATDTVQLPLLGSWTFSSLPQVPLSSVARCAGGATRRRVGPRPVLSATFSQFYILGNSFSWRSGKQREIRSLREEVAQFRTHVSTHLPQQPLFVPPPPAAPHAVSSLPRFAFVRSSRFEPPRLDPPNPDHQVNLRCRRSGWSAVSSTCNVRNCRAHCTSLRCPGSVVLGDVSPCLNLFLFKAILLAGGPVCSCFVVSFVGPCETTPNVLQGMGVCSRRMSSDHPRTTSTVSGWPATPAGRSTTKSREMLEVWTLCVFCIVFRV